MIAAGVRFGCVVADAGYGLSARFRQGLALANLAGPLAFRATSRCTLLMSRWSDRLRGAAVPLSAFQILYQWRLKMY